MNSEHRIAALCVVVAAALLGSGGYAWHLGSVREDQIRLECIHVGGTPIKSTGNETICVRSR